jgi:hypothetical protein
VIWNIWGGRRVCFYEVYLYDYFGDFGYADWAMKEGEREGVGKLYVGLMYS